MYQNSPFFTPSNTFSPNYYMGNQYSMNGVKQEVVRVHGWEGANAYNMGANSSALLLDDTNPMVWFVMTDGAGYKTITPYTITPYKPPEQVDVSSLEKRIHYLEEVLNVKPDSGNAE